MEDLHTSAGAGKLLRSFASLRMTKGRAYFRFAQDDKVKDYFEPGSGEMPSVPAVPALKS